MPDKSPEQLLAQYSEAKQNLAKARAEFLEQLKAKGIDPRFIIEERKDKFRDCWESCEESWRQHDPPHTVVWIDQTEFADYWSAKWRFESVQEHCRAVMEGLWPQYEAWQYEWDTYLYQKYGVHPAGGFGPELDADKAAELKADLDRKRHEYDDWKAQLCAPKVPVPSGWEGQRPAWEIKSLADLDSYLSGILDQIREFGLDESYAPFNKRFIDEGREAIRNAYRILGQLKIFDRPKQPTDLNEPFKVESALDELLAWIGRTAVADSDAPNTDDVNEFLRLAEEIVARIEETEGPEWWADVAQLSRQLEEIRRRIGFPKWTLDEPQLPAFYVTSVYKGCELHGIDAEFADILLPPVTLGDVYGNGVMLLGDPLADRCGEQSDLWRQYDDSPKVEYLPGTAERAVLHLRRWIRAFSRMLDDEGEQSQTTIEAGGGEQVEPKDLADEQTPMSCSTSGSVRLFSRQDSPIVNGKRKDTLTNAQYDVILALLDAGERGLTKDALDRESKHGDARKILKRLADGDRDWEIVISFPGVAGKGYRIL